MVYFWPRYVLLVCLCMLLAACAAEPKTSDVQPTETLSAESTEREALLNPDEFKPYWWYIRFRLHWPDNENPDWTLDTLLADLVCAPALVDFGQVIQLWRFHRRAARDGAGRQFSFIFYTDEESAQAINRYINSNPLVQELLLRGLLEQVRFEQSSQRPNIEDTSDKAWAEVVQKSWPFFIMGVSETWLDLIERVAIDRQLNIAQETTTLLEGYRQVSTTVDEIWRLHGRHAFLHHLNAVFGYQPLLMRY